MSAFNHQIIRQVSDAISLEMLNQNIPALKSKEFNLSVIEYVWSSYGRPTAASFKHQVSVQDHCIQELEKWMKSLNDVSILKRSLISIAEEIKEFVVWFVYHAALVLGFLHLSLMVMDLITRKTVKFHFS